MNGTKLTTAVAIFCVTLASSAFSAQTVEKDLGGNGNWKAALVTDHTLWHKNACLAFTKSSDGNSFLELYAEQGGEVKGSFVEPTVQIVTKELGFVRAVLSDENADESYQLTLSSTRDQKPAFGLLARLSERKKIVDFIKRAADARVTLVGPKGKVLKTLSFSLKGSTKTIDATFAACKLVL